MRAFERCGLALVATAVTIVVSEPDDHAKSLTILKCCRYGEELRPDGAGNASGDGLPRCEPTSNEWKPLIYSPSRQKFNDNDDLPADWHIVDGRRPECDDISELIHVPYRAANPFILLDNGNAVLEVGNTDSFPASHYCADSNALLVSLVCMSKKSAGNQAAATMRPRVRRCCGENASFHERGNTCVFIKETADAPPLLPNASSAVEIVSGFPTCSKSDNFTIVGNAMDAALQPNGSLGINRVVLPSGKFCVERIKELDQIAKVFACPEHAPQRPAVKATDIRFTLYPVGFIISAVFLATTRPVGYYRPLITFCTGVARHVACLMMGDILMAIIQLAGILFMVQVVRCSVTLEMARIRVKRLEGDRLSGLNEDSSSVNKIEKALEEVSPAARRMSILTKPGSSRILQPTNTNMQGISSATSNSRKRKIDKVISSPSLANSEDTLHFTIVKFKEKVRAMAQTDSNLRDFYKCMALNCKFTTDDLSEYSQHYIQHDEEASEQNNTENCDYNKCAYCYEIQTDLNTMKSHLLTVHGHCRFQCGYCLCYRAIVCSYVRQHQAIYHPKEKYHVLVGSQQNGETKDVKQKYVNYIKPYICRHDCDKTFYIREEFTTHLRTKHPSSQLMYKCHLCDATHETVESLICHYKFHKFGTYQCLYCEHGAESLSDMHHHMSFYHWTKPSQVLERSLPQKLKKDKENRTTIGCLRTMTTYIDERKT